MIIPGAHKLMPSYFCALSPLKILVITPGCHLFVIFMVLVHDQICGKLRRCQFMKILMCLLGGNCSIMNHERTDVFTRW